VDDPGEIQSRISSWFNHSKSDKKVGIFINAGSTTLWASETVLAVLLRSLLFVCKETVVKRPRRGLTRRDIKVNIGFG
jgi:hypothetical protein